MYLYVYLYVHGAPSRLAKARTPTGAAHEQMWRGLAEGWWRRRWGCHPFSLGRWRRERRQTGGLGRKGVRQIEWRSEEEREGRGGGRGRVGGVGAGLSVREEGEEISRRWSGLVMVGVSVREQQDWGEGGGFLAPQHGAVPNRAAPRTTLPATAGAAGATTRTTPANGARHRGQRRWPAHRAAAQAAHVPPCPQSHSTASAPRSRHTTHVPSPSPSPPPPSRRGPSADDVVGSAAAGRLEGGGVEEGAHTMAPSCPSSLSPSLFPCLCPTARIYHLHAFRDPHPNNEHGWPSIASCFSPDQRGSSVKTKRAMDGTRIQFASLSIKWGNALHDAVEQTIRAVESDIFKSRNLLQLARRRQIRKCFDLRPT